MITQSVARLRIAQVNEAITALNIHPVNRRIVEHSRSIDSVRIRLNSCRIDAKC
jgi:hypothetical protein